MWIIQNTWPGGKESWPGALWADQVYGQVSTTVIGECELGLYMFHRAYKVGLAYACIQTFGDDQVAPNVPEKKSAVSYMSTFPNSSSQHSGKLLDAESHSDLSFP